MSSTRQLRRLTRKCLRLWQKSLLASFATWDTCHTQHHNKDRPDVMVSCCSNELLETKGTVDWKCYTGIAPFPPQYWDPSGTLGKLTVMWSWLLSSPLAYSLSGMGSRWCSIGLLLFFGGVPESAIYGIVVCQASIRVPPSSPSFLLYSLAFLLPSWSAYSLLGHIAIAIGHYHGVVI